MTNLADTGRSSSVPEDLERGMNFPGKDGLKQPISKEMMRPFEQLVRALPCVVGVLCRCSTQGVSPAV
jgi:hypothetical protein